MIKHGIDKLKYILKEHYRISTISIYFLCEEIPNILSYNYRSIMI